MTAVLFENISELRTVSALGTLANAAIVADDGRIAWIGPTTQAPAADTRINLGGRAVLPGWVDSHTHMLFDGNRAAEFEARMAGQSYAAGGINVTVTATRAATDTRLEQLLHDRINAARAGGTTTLETKTGYGLDVESERRAARIPGGPRDAGRGRPGRLCGPGVRGHAGCGCPLRPLD